MRYGIVRTIVVKELTETLRDRRTLLMMVGLPVLLYPMLLIGFSKLQQERTAAQRERVSRVAVWGTLSGDLRAALVRAGRLALTRWHGAPAHVREALEAGRIDLPRPPDPSDEPPGSARERAAAESAREPEADSVVAAAARDVIDRHETDVVLVLGAGFDEAIDRGELARGAIYFDSVREDSVAARDRLARALEAHRRAILTGRERRQGLADGFATAMAIATRNVASGSRRAGQILSLFLPFLLIALSLLGGFYPAIDLTAGEKERGTMQTLLCAPVRPAEIIVGKFLAVWTIALVAALANVLSMAATMARIVPGQVGVGGGVYALVLAMLLPVTFLISAVFLAVAVFATDFKDGQNFLTPVYMVLGMPAAVTMLPAIELTRWTAFVPVVNIALLIKALLLDQASVDLVFITLVAAAVHATLAILLASRVFEREQILLGGRESMATVLGLDRRPGAATPGPTFALVAFAALLVLAFYGSLSLERTGVVATLLVTELGFFLLPTLVLVLAFRFDLRATLNLAWPGWRGVAAAVLVGLTGWAVAAGVFVRLLPPPDSLVRALERILLIDGRPMPVWTAWLLIGLTPAVCEELFFRGLVLSAFRRTGFWPAVLTSALLFGVAHASIYRLLPTLFLGALFAYLVWRTGSVVCGIIAHAVSNGLMATIALDADLARRLGLADTTSVPWMYTLAGVAVVTVAVLLVRGDGGVRRAQQR